MPEGGGVGALEDSQPAEAEIANPAPEGEGIAPTAGHELELAGAAPPLPPPSNLANGDAANGLQNGNGKAKKNSTLRHGASIISEAGDGQDAKSVIQKMDEGGKGADFKRMLKVAARSGSEVPRASVMGYLGQEIDQNQKCLEFPFICLYFVLFSMMVILHEQIVDVSQVERNFNGFLSGTTFEGIYVNKDYPVGGHKDLEDIDLVADVWTYLHDAVFPLFLNPNQTTPANDLDRVLRYNQLIGGLSLKQSRLEKKLCDEQHPDLGPKNSAGKNPFLQDFMCFPSGTVGKECYGPGAALQGFCPSTMTGAASGGRRLDFSKHAARPRLGVGKSKSIKINPVDAEVWDNLFVVMMHSHEGLTEGTRRLKELMANNWIDEQTALLEVSLFTLNPDLGVYTQSTTSIYFVPDGGILPFVTTTSFLSRPYSHVMVFVVDGLWFLMWLQLSGTWFYRLCKVYGCKGSLKDGFMLVDALCMIGGAIMIIFWVIYVITLGDVQDAVVNVTIGRPELDPAKRVTPYADTMLTYEQSISDLHKQVSYMVAFIDLYRVGICWYSLLCVVRFFKAFRAQPRLAIVTNTIIGCAVDFIHFFIVFWVMFMSYVLAAMFLFGHRLEQFSRVQLAVDKCYLLLLGDFDFDELMEENPVTAGLWFYTFVIFMVNIMLNMCLAIIMDVYGQAKGDAALSDPIWDQLWTMWVEFRSQSYGIVKFVDVMEVLTAMDIEYIGKNSLMEAIPAMGEEQAQALITKVEELEEADDEQSLTLADALKLVVSTKSNVQDIDAVLSNYIQSQQDTKEKLVSKPTLGGSSARTPGNSLVLHPDSDKRIRKVEQSLDVIENFLNESMAYMVFRGKELRNRLKSIEDTIRRQRDATATGNSDLWQNPTNLGGRSASPPPPKLTNGAPDRPLPITFSA